VTAQLTGQGRMLQFWVLTKLGHALPPYAGCTVTVRVWRCEPPPHVAEQADHDDQPLTSQWTGQLWVLQGCVRRRAGHAEPPWAACVNTTRVWNWEPSPHERPHVDQADHAL